MDDLLVCWLGTVPYREALALQERARDAVAAGTLGEVLLLLEHPPTYTRGRRSTPDELPFGEDWYAARGIEVVDVRRGGKVTYHAPGQLVGYPIVRVERVLPFVRVTEDALVAALRAEGVASAHSRPDEGPPFIGVWCADRKVAQLGFHVRGGVSTHGFSVNVDLDLEPWSWIVPCGLPDAHPTSVAAEKARAAGEVPGGDLCALGTGVDPVCFRKRVAAEFCRAHGRRQRLLAPAGLHRMLDTVSV